MKILTVCVLGFAVMALVRAAAFEKKRAKNDQTESSDLVKRYLHCSWGWTYIDGACLKYVPKPMTWGRAERNCRSMGAHLASVLNINKYHAIQNMIADATHDYKEAWIGGSDAQHEGVWLWSDGETMQFTNWCPGEPNNALGSQHCIQMNYGDQKCWDDQRCETHLPSVCAQRRRF
ncbi:hypothetical protein Q5P01_002837 [Channa striata]|uniref:C-type lectin domain-containing protein n=1 Tax=Channa striata TaxID=64152 RepID=A0AA88NV03_CHASR|nr:hypothetical protein Q5P01_002837 [Channa striata]